MINRFAFAALAAVAISTPAFAADDVMAARYGNTTIATYADGTQQKIYYTADHNFSGSQGGAAFKGTWKIDDKNTLCLTFEKAPAGAANPTCAPAAAHKVGDTWMVKASGRDVTVSLVAGKQ